VLLVLVVGAAPTSQQQRAVARWVMRRRAVGRARGADGAVRATSRPAAAGPATCGRRMACAGAVRGCRSAAATSRPRLRGDLERPPWRSAASSTVQEFA